MAKARLMTLVGAATVLAAGLTSASAQVLNLTGQFQCVRLCRRSGQRDVRQEANPTAPTERFSCFDSGRMHPNPFFQQAYAFTTANIQKS